MTALTLDTILPSLLGGMMIGLAAALMLLGAGRIAGISGVFFSVVAGPRAAPRTAFLIGLLSAALIASAAGWLHASALLPNPQWLKLIAAGLLVGIGTNLGSGCTSGHGVCGIANGSGRGFTATVIFMAVAIVVVALGYGGVA